MAFRRFPAVSLPRPAATPALSRLLTAGYAAVILAAALALRLAAAQGELWLDEVWSLELASQASQLTDVFTRLHHDNNHPLNTACLWLLGEHQPWVIYRLPAVVAGTLAVGCGGLIASRWGPPAAATSLIVLASSNLLVHYASEARGYGLVMLCVLAAIECWIRFLIRPRWTWGLAFSASCVLGLLSHPIFLHFWLASLYWSWISLSPAKGIRAEQGSDAEPEHAAAAREPAGSGLSRRQRWLRGAVCQSIPLLAAVLLAATSWRHLELGGGPPYSLPAQLVEAASLAAGGPAVAGSQPDWGAVLAATAGLAALAWSLPQLDRFRLGALVLAACAIPVLQSVALRPPFLFARYFLVPALLGLLATSIGLGRLARQGRMGRAGQFVLLLLFLGTNSWFTWELAAKGRGQYRQALARMAAETAEEVITISSDHNFGIGKLVSFYGPLAAPGRQFCYVPGQEWPAEGPRWLVLHRSSPGDKPREASLTIDGHLYQLSHVAECGRLSGWRWLCYRRQP